MQVDNKESWKGWQENGDPKVVAFGKRWAELMEAELKRGKAVEQVADETLRRANTDHLSVDGLYEASQMLLSVWAHSDALYAWKTKR